MDVVHRKIRAATLVALTVIFAPIFTYIIGFSTNHTNFVPLEEEHTIPIRFGAYLGTVKYNETADLNIGIWVRFKGTLVAGKEATVDAAGYINSTIANHTVQIVDVFFKLSVAWPIHNDSNGLPAENRVSLYRNWIYGPILFEANTIHLAFPNPGDYAPTVSVVFYNHTEKRADFPYVAVRVEPVTQKQTEDLNRINLGLTYALVAFGIIEIAVSSSEYVEKYFEDKSTVDGNDQAQSKRLAEATNEGKQPPRVTRKK